MEKINLRTWSRYEHFKLFSSFDNPHFNMCANLDLTVFYPFIKQQRIKFTIGIVYLIARVANEIPEFRYRIREGDVIEHEIVHPSTTILAKDDAFSFCKFKYEQSFARFAVQAAEKIDCLQENPSLVNEQGDDVLYLTAIPWISFTSFMHPMNLRPADSIPRFAWGKYFEEGRCIKMPLGVQGHHALMDGIHMGKYYTEIQNYLYQPHTILCED